MLGWVGQVLREGIVTTRYPKRPEPQPAGVRNHLTLTGTHPSSEAARRAVAACPTAALTRDGGRLRLDLGLCIQCGRCLEAAPDAGLAFMPEYELATRDRADLVEEIKEVAK